MRHGHVQYRQLAGCILIYFTLLFAVAIVTKNKGDNAKKSKIKVNKLNDKYDEMTKQIESEILSKKEFKNKLKK